MYLKAASLVLSTVFMSNDTTLNISFIIIVQKDTESWCWTVLVQIPLWACQKRTVWSYPAVARITGSLPTVPWFTFMLGLLVVNPCRNSRTTLHRYIALCQLIYRHRH